MSTFSSIVSSLILAAVMFVLWRSGVAAGWDMVWTLTGLVVLQGVAGILDGRLIDLQRQRITLLELERSSHDPD